ncbi:MAG: hypothetical protein GX130_12540 [Candidatus Hydrogenedens sp.]|jgi:hypothetical protein|nr:hypothetical protein [Candidatus Hydrogenedens sp.]
MKDLYINPLGLGCLPYFGGAILFVTLFLMVNIALPVEFISAYTELNPWRAFGLMIVGEGAVALLVTGVIFLRVCQLRGNIIFLLYVFMCLWAYLFLILGSVLSPFALFALFAPFSGVEAEELVGLCVMLLIIIVNFGIASSLFQEIVSQIEEKIK